MPSAVPTSNQCSVLIANCHSPNLQQHWSISVTISLPPNICPPFRAASSSSRSHVTDPRRSKADSAILRSLRRRRCCRRQYCRPHHVQCSNPHRILLKCNPLLNLVARQLHRPRSPCSAPLNWWPTALLTPRPPSAALRPQLSASCCCSLLLWHSHLPTPRLPLL